MECNAVLEMYIQLYRQQQVVLDLIVIDDDSSIRSKLKWNNEDHMKNHNTTTVPKVQSQAGLWPTRPNKGRIPGDIPEPTFGADPNHRTKLVGKEVYGLARRNKSETYTMTEMDAYRLKRNYGYMIRAIPDLREDQYEEAARAVVQHHFDNHQYCGEWCKRRLLTAAQLEASTKYYRCKQKDADLYKVLRSQLDRFMTLKAMKEISHGHDTQVNESLNCTVSWNAPKNKVYSSSGSLKNRLALAVCIHSIGTLAFYTRLFGRLGMVLEPDVLHYFVKKDKNRSAKIERAKKTDFKRKRNERKHDKLLADTAVAKRERHARDGTYETGMGMDDGYTEADFDDADLDQSIECKRCGRKGHKSARSKGCKYYTKPKPRKKKATTATASGAAAIAQRDADEADKLDEMPFDTPIPNDDPDSDDDDGFFDAFEFETGII